MREAFSHHLRKGSSSASASAQDGGHDRNRDGDRHGLVRRGPGTGPDRGLPSRSRSWSPPFRRPSCKSATRSTPRRCAVATPSRRWAQAPAAAPEVRRARSTCCARRRPRTGGSTGTTPTTVSTGTTPTTAASATVPTAPPATASPAPGPLALTGARIIEALLIAAALIGLGTVLVVFQRRRRRTT